MSVRDISLDPKILENAKQEFLKYGFKDASLKEICLKAGVTTGAVYKRYTGKAALFEALVRPTLEDLDKLVYNQTRKNNELMATNKLVCMWDMPEEVHKGWINYFYDRYEGMKLLLCCSKGTKYENFLCDFVKNNTNICLQFVETAKMKGLKVNDIDRDELHIFLTAYWSTIFETIIHDFSREKALAYCKKISKFFNWKIIFGF